MVLDEIRRLKIVPVIVIDDPAQALGLADALAGGGLPCAEITFRTPAASTQGNLGRNSFRGPGLASVDLSLGRTFAVKRMGESGRFRVRADAFNFLNHANLNSPDSFLNSRTFGIAAWVIRIVWIRRSSPFFAFNRPRYKSTGPSNAPIHLARNVPRAEDATEPPIA
jgi:hypothetical protein